MRCTAVGVAVDRNFPFPVTQTELGDATGLSLVHVNRTLQELRRDGLITLQAKTVTIQDWEGLQRAAEFDPRYLHIEGEALRRTNGAPVTGPTLLS